MENAERTDGLMKVHGAYRLSWLAYIWPFFIFLFLLGIGVLCPWKVGIAFYVVGVVYFVYKVLDARSLVLYMDNDGVWCSGGILPWTKGTGGVKWRDLDEATFTTGFASWALKSYRVRIGHRFTKSSEILIPHLSHGNAAVQEINRRHRELLAAHLD